jgi:mRNA-degrading endonuclease HigB of HigAB toxin-antitoxin module
MRRTLPVGVVIGLAVLVAVACGRRDANDRGGVESQGNVAHRDSALVLGPGDVRIVNEDSSVEMAVVGQQIVVRLSDKTMEKVRRETDTTALKDSGFAASIEKVVKRTVQSALGQQFTYPLTDVRDAKYEDGAIVLDVKGKQPRLLANTKFNGRKLLESFRPDDAKRFVAAVNAKKAR